MKHSTVDPACTGQFSLLFLDYIQRNEKLSHFYKYFPTLENFGEAIANRSFSGTSRAVLVEELEMQYQSIPDREVVDGNIQLLKRNTTFTVTTGHQLNLMTGPLYFVYKIVSTINLAKRLKEAYPEYDFVPVYWMASEDHDFDEINHFVFSGRKYSWMSTQQGPVGEFEIDKALRDLIAELRFLPDFFRDAYLNSSDLAAAVRKYVHHLFGKDGLLVLDANVPALKKRFAPVIKDDLTTQRANELVQLQNENLEKLGYETQIFPREVNFFYMEKGIRERIVPSEDGYRTANKDLSWSRSELLELVDRHPERFSPNVVMRPLYQEAILPNLAYLGGPAEVAYWFQLKGVFDHYGIDYPAVMPRNFGLLVSQQLSKKIHSLGLSLEDLFKPFDELRISFTRTHAESDLELTEERALMEELYGRLEGKLGEVDPTLAPATAAARERGMKILNQLAKKLRKAEERKLGDAIARIREIKQSLFPGGIPQERKANMLDFYLDYPDLVEMLKEVFDPLAFEVVVVELNA